MNELQRKFPYRIDFNQLNKYEISVHFLTQSFIFWGPSHLNSFETNISVSALHLFSIVQCEIWIISSQLFIFLWIYYTRCWYKLVSTGFWSSVLWMRRIVCRFVSFWLFNFMSQISTVISLTARKVLKTANRYLWLPYFTLFTILNSLNNNNNNIQWTNTIYLQMCLEMKLIFVIINHQF